MRKIIRGNVSLRNLCLKELLDLSNVELEGYYWCNNNYLTNLKGAPKLIGGDFDCTNNELTSLNGGPKTVVGNFLCNKNNLTSLIGAPHTVGASFHCYGNDLTSLEGIPKNIGYRASFKGDLWISKELRDRFPEEYIRSLSDIKGTVVYRNIPDPNHHH